MVVESLPTARCAPKCEKTVQALLCHNLIVKLGTLLNDISSRRIRLQDDIGMADETHIPTLEELWDTLHQKPGILDDLVEDFILPRLP